MTTIFSILFCLSCMMYGINLGEFLFHPSKKEFFRLVINVIIMIGLGYIAFKVV